MGVPESLPLPQLVSGCLDKLRDSRVLERASRSPVYRSRWQATGVDPTRVRTYADLALIPFTTTGHLRAALADTAPADLAADAGVRLWVSTSGTTGRPKWIPVGEKDVVNIIEGIPRMIAMVAAPADDISFISLSAPAPFVSESWLYLAFFNYIQENRAANAAMFTLAEAAEAMAFARKAGSRTLFAFPSIAAMIGEQLPLQAAAEARKLFLRKKSLRNFLAMAVTRVIGVKASHVFRMRRGMFAGEPVAPYAAVLRRSFNLEAFSAYASTESANVVIIECGRHRGLHVFLDTCLPEIIPEASLEREREDSAFRPHAIPLWEAPPGLSGELVLTTFSEAFPLVRFRTSDLVQVVDTGACACGCSHPRITILHRCDDVINLGLIRFSVYLLKQKLEAVTGRGGIGEWRLRLTRDGVKPKMVLEVKPGRPGAGAEAALRREIMERIDEIEGVRQGRENGLIAEPEIRFVEHIDPERGHSGKDRLVIYEPAYFEGS
jgi:phenylacetate-coenzyme A ligase PaaK-like adenylate-forming protein